MKKSKWMFLCGVLLSLSAAQFSQVSWAGSVEIDLAIRNLDDDRKLLVILSTIFASFEHNYRNQTASIEILGEALETTLKLVKRPQSIRTVQRCLSVKPPRDYTEARSYKKKIWNIIIERLGCLQSQIKDFKLRQKNLLELGSENREADTDTEIDEDDLEVDLACAKREEIPTSQANLYFLFKDPDHLFDKNKRKELENFYLQKIHTLFLKTVDQGREDEGKKAYYFIVQFGRRSEISIQFVSESLKGQVSRGQSVFQEVLPLLTHAYVERRLLDDLSSPRLEFFMEVCQSIIDFYTQEKNF